MKNYQTITTAILSSAALFSVVSCDVKKTEDGNLPDVKVEVKGDTKLPKYDVDVADVKIEKKKVEVEVPTVEIEMPEAGTEAKDK